jgi:hypothetical protein
MNKKLIDLLDYINLSSELRTSKGHKLLAAQIAAETTTAAATGAPAPMSVVDLGWDYDSNTACWSWNGSRRCHEIKVGIFSTVQLEMKHRSDINRVRQFIAALIDHECSHGLFSSRDLAAIATKLEADKIPFRLLNLLEDARIEHRGRAAGLSYGWDAVGVERERAVITPAGFLFALVSSEASAAADPLKHGLNGVIWCGSSHLPDGREVLPLVVEFYGRMCAAATTEEVVPILMEWVAAFGMDYREVPVSVGTAIGPVQDKTDEWVIGNIQGKRPDSVKHDGWKGWPHFAHSGAHIGQYMDTRAVNRIKTSMLALLNAQEHTPDHFASEGPALNLGGIMSGEAESFFTVTKQRAEGQRKVLLVVDMSGSMSVFWACGGGREFVLALVQMAQGGEVDLRIILSGHGTRAELPVDGLRACDLISIHPSGGDSLEDTLATPVAREAIEWATSVIVWTDGDLNAGDRVGFKLAQSGVRFLAASTCTNKRAAMLAQFPCVACDDEVAIVAAQVAELILEGDADRIREGEL